MKGFMLGFLVASVLGAGVVWAQQVLTDPYGHVQGYLSAPPQPGPNFMGPPTANGQLLNSILQNSRNPC